MTTAPATPAQQRTLDAIETYRRQYDRSPTYRELAEILGVRPVTVFGNVKELARKGLVNTSARSARGIVPADCCPTCGRRRE